MLESYQGGEVAASLQDIAYGKSYIIDKLIRQHDVMVLGYQSQRVHRSDLYIPDWYSNADPTNIEKCTIRDLIAVADLFNCEKDFVVAKASRRPAGMGGISFLEAYKCLLKKLFKGLIPYLYH